MKRKRTDHGRRLGIGAAIAEVFARAGALVFATDRDEAAGRETRERIIGAGHRAEFMTLDISDELQCAAVSAAVLVRAGHLNVLVNNAGIGHVGTMETTSAADLDHLHAVNVRGTFNVTKAFFPSMLLRRAGVIINIASIGGIVGVRFADCFSGGVSYMVWLL